MKEHWRDYFRFSRRERTGILVLLTLIVLAWSAPLFFPVSFKEADRHTVDYLEQQLALLQAKGAQDTQDLHAAAQEPDGRSALTGNKAPATLFYFDPNTLSAADWQKLGLNDRAIRTIQHYLAKGGRFRQPEDIGKIYGLQRGQALALMPYVRIEGNMKPVSGPGTKAYMPPPAYKRPALSPIDINTADTSAFIALPGIGSKLAGRIVLFREKLGGFVNVQQIAEVYGLQDSVFQQLTPLLLCAAPVVKKLNINVVEAEQLAQHPYIRWKLANAIVQYRRQHGRFENIETLGNIALVTKEWFEKAGPYLATD